MLLMKKTRMIYQTIQLGYGALAAGLADVPDFDTAFATSVDMTRRVAYGNSTHNLSVAKCVDLTGMSGDSRANEGIWWEGYRLHLAICTDVKGVSPVGEKNK